MTGVFGGILKDLLDIGGSEIKRTCLETIFENIFGERTGFINVEILTEFLEVEVAINDEFTENLEAFAKGIEIFWESFVCLLRNGD